MRLRYVRVLDDRVDLVLEADPSPVPREVSERAAATLLAWLPGLESHHCSTGDTRTFAEEMCDTETPHLFEHVVLELLRRAGSVDEVRGETVWRKGDDAYLVSIFDYDDALCLSAARLALRLVDSAFGDGGPLDLDAEIARVAALR
ncbi:MAG: cyanophycin synthetase family protein [Coriobacteriia bacterium]